MGLPLSNFTGNGFVSAKTGKTSVSYELWMAHCEIPAGSADDTTAAIGGLQRVEGWVFPVCGRLGEKLTLETNEGSKVGFYFRDREGSIADGVVISDFTGSSINPRGR